MTDKLGNLRDYGVSEGFGSLHPMGNPIIHSTNAGVGRIPSAGRPPSRCVVRQSLRVFPKVGLVKPRLLRGVGNNPETISLVGRANVSSGYAVPFRIEPERGQVAENASKPSIKQCCDVLHDDEAGSKLASEPCNFSPKARAFSRQPRSEALIADILAWEASADNVDGGDFLASQIADISVAGDTGPVLGEHSSGERFDFAECDGLETARAFEAKGEPSYTAEKIEDAQLVHLRTPRHANEQDRDVGNQHEAADRHDDVEELEANVDGFGGHAAICRATSICERVSPLIGPS